MTFSDMHPVVQALVAGLFTWGLTAAGASVVFWAKTISRRLLDTALGFAAGVMIAASFWSLLAPAIVLSRDLGAVPWVPPAIGFLAGGAVMRLVEWLLPHIHPLAPANSVEGVRTHWHRAVLLVLAITLHNVPEGLAIGVAFGAADSVPSSTTLGGAIALAIGIGLQNCPEGLAVAVPLRAEGVSRTRSFWYGQLSAIVEPLFAAVGAAAIVAARPALPYALAFAAGAMIFVVIEEVIPESQRGGRPDLATMAAMIGFAFMMCLDVALA